MKQTVLIFSALIIAILALFQLGKYSVISGDTQIELIIGVIAVVFFFIGMYLNKQQTRIEPRPREIDHNLIESFDISKREYEVLQHIASGLSNKEIAEKLFLSESTIKTHVSNLLVKLNAKRRTQAIQIAKSKNLI